MRTALFFVVLAPAVLLAVRSQFFSLLVYVAFSLALPEQWVYSDLSPLRLSLVLGLLVALPREWMFRRKGADADDPNPLDSAGLPYLVHPLSIGAILFLGTALVAQQNAVAPDVGWHWLDYLWRVILMMTIAISLISTERRLYWVLAVSGGAIALHSAKAGIVSLLYGGIRFDNGLGGAFSDNNGYALAIVMALPFMVAAAQNAPNRWMRAGFWAAVPASMYTIVSTYSRGGFLGLAVCVVLFLALQRRKFVALASCAAVAGLIVLFVPVPQAYLNRLQTIQTYEQVDETSALSRLHFWTVATRIAADHPLGIGLFNFEAAYDRYDTSLGKYGHKRAVHSAHFQVLAEQGYAGLVIWIGCFLTAFGLAFRARKRSRDPNRSPESQRLLFTSANALIVSMAGFLVGGSFLAVSLNDFTWLVFGMVAAIDRISGVPVKAAAETPATPAGSTPDAGAITAPRFQGAYRRPPAATRAIAGLAR